GAQAHLRDRLLARYVDGTVAAAGGRCGRLDQKGRLADARVAPHQQHGAAHEAAAGDPVELGNAGGQAGGVVGLARGAFYREHAALAGAAAGHRPLQPGTLFRNRVPFAAALALALPAAMDGPAVLADEALLAARHGSHPRMRAENKDRTWRFGQAP